MAKSIIYNAQTKTTEIIETPDLPIEPMPDMPAPPPTLEEKVAEHDSKIVTMEEALDAVFGGV